MRVKNVKSSFLILLTLAFSSFAFLAIAEENSGSTADIFAKADETSSGNLTQDMAQKIIDASTNVDPENPGVSTDQLQSIIESAINQNSSSDETSPEVDISQLNIIRQDYSGLTAKRATEKEKEDFVKYIASLYYIFSSNSPQPITSSSDILKAISSTTEAIIYAISKESPQAVRDLSASGEKISEQLKKMEVPEKLVDLHVKAITYADNTATLQKYISPTTDDPVKKLVNLGKLQGFIESLSSFSEEVDARMDQYGVSYDDPAVKDRLNKLGLPELIDNSTTTATTVTNDTTSTTDTTDATDSTNVN